MLQHDVGRLDITMDDTGCMKRAEAGAQLSKDRDCLHLREGVWTPQTRGKCLAPEKFHREKQEGRHASGRTSDVIDGAKIRMNDLARQKNFLLKTMGRTRACGNMRKDDLQGNANILQEEILYFIDLPHATASDDADYAKAFDDELIGLEIGRLKRNIFVGHSVGRLIRGGKLMWAMI